jgi:hypothetical protein
MRQNRTLKKIKNVADFFALLSQKMSNVQKKFFKARLSSAAKNNEYSSLMLASIAPLPQ